MVSELTSVRHEVPDTLEAIEYCYRQGWTDGLPVVPPTQERVREFLAYAGLDPETVVGEVPDRARVITAEKVDMDVALAEQDIVEAGRALVAAHPEVGAIVLECTNMPPYAAALQAAVGLPVYDIYSMITWFHAGLRPRRFR